MEIDLYVKRKYDVTLAEIESFLECSGWEREPHNEKVNKYRCVKYPKVYAVLPMREGELTDEKSRIIDALRVVERVNNGCGIEAIINRIKGDADAR